MNRSPLIAAVIEILHQGESLLQAIDDDTYTQKLSSVFGSAIGGHYRHCLDHFQNLLDGLQVSEINYDDRRRDRRIEVNRVFALEQTQRIAREFNSTCGDFLDCPIFVRSKVNYALEQSPLISSTVGREIMYSVAHSIHHYALIAVMCSLLDVTVPHGFGVAPSTLQHQAEQGMAAAA